jgi:hypothetical protein
VRLLRLGPGLRVGASLARPGKVVRIGIGALVGYSRQSLLLVDAAAPAGLALGQPDPRPYLRPGDVTEPEIDGLDRARQKLVAA